ISLSGSAQQCLQLIAPILRDLSDNQKDRWLTLVSPPQQITAQWLRNAGLNRERILVLRPRGLQSSQELACEALRLGRSHTVISWFNPLPTAAQAQLVNAALVGAAQSLNIRQPFTI
ncbi:MAG TPA: CDP-glycerol--UDP-pyrophosphoryl-N-acetylglucosaminyl-N-acetylmannosamine glycerophosphotransferase, partial [Pseudomonas sp.]|nr:CDP-glycerol--UDP-pyrophosphoryl-N-acetylglucosaminyl-N-acetylmannosamine glycerophosphotransferase [Pseudomonas sp.]